MIIPHMFSDAQGHSNFGELELKLAGNDARIQTADQDVNYWQVEINQPGDSIDWHPSGMNRFLAVLSGQMDLTVSNGDVRRLSRGDMLLAADLAGQGHTTKFVGLDPCMIISITMPGGFK